MQKYVFYLLLTGTGLVDCNAHVVHHIPADTALKTKEKQH